MGVESRDEERERGVLSVVGEFASVASDPSQQMDGVVVTHFILPFLIISLLYHPPSPSYTLSTYFALYSHPTDHLYTFPIIEIQVHLYKNQ
jgi:hypothetical protein